MYSVEAIKAMGKNKSDENFDALIKIFTGNYDIEIKREAVSSIGRQEDSTRIYEFISREAFNKSNPMELIYQMFRTCLYRSSKDKKFHELRNRIMNFYHNEVIDKMNAYYEFRHQRDKTHNTNRITRPMLIIGDSEETIKQYLNENSIQLIFTSPPYYNAREYSDYSSYREYLAKMKRVFDSCSYVLEPGRFMIVNVSPVITKRPGREFESIRYPIHYDLHSVLCESGFYFIDEIIWIKPEPSVPDRISGYKQTRKPLSYKPNCVTESIMIYRKNCNFLLDRNMKSYVNYDRHEDESINTSNCWYIAPKSDKNHPAVFPEELCRRILKYYSFEGDAVLDPFAGSGTLGRMAMKMGRVPVMCEMNEEYAKIIMNNGGGYYDVRGSSSEKYGQKIIAW